MKPSRVPGRYCTARSVGAQAVPQPGSGAGPHRDQWNTVEARELPTFRIESLTELPEAIAKFNERER
ncbi:hypothetical protein [Streptomyces sioyaensis]|uniref:hypothetical protein n=1 Tax=Streptomyces sioyaensis TaxID=67364 RepID=UPI0037B5216D